MAATTTTLRYSATQLFEMLKDDYEPDLHDLLLSQITALWPGGIGIPVHFVIGEGQKPTRH